MPRHAAQDRLPDAEAIFGHGVQVEARTVVPDKRLNGLGAHLDIGGYRRGAMPDGIEQGLAQGPHQRSPADIERSITGDHQLDRHAVQVLHLVRNLRDCGGEAGLRAERAGIQPTAQLSLLGARQTGHLGGVVRLALDQGQGLEDGVVQVPGDVCSRGLTDALCLLGAQVTPETHTPRRGDQSGPGKHRHGRDPHLPQAGEPTSLGRENDDPDGRQRDANPETYQASSSICTTADQPLAPLRIVEL